MYKYLITLCACVMAVPSVVAQLGMSASVRTDTISYESPNTIFEVNKTTLKHKLDPPDTPDPSFWDYYMIVVEGTASPEGPTWNNERLARGRARLLSDSIKSWWRQSIPQIDTLVKERIIIENYPGLRRQMELSDETYSKSVIEIIDRYQGDISSTKSALRSLDHGKIWLDLLNKYYPFLRYANVYIEGRHSRDQRVIIPPTGIIEDNALIDINTDSLGLQSKFLHLPAQVADLGAPISKDLKVNKHQPIINFKTNLLYDLPILTPNLSVELLRAHPHLTPVLEVMWSQWRNDHRQRTWIIHSLFGECRYYLRQGKEKQYTGYYFSVYGNIGCYDIQLGANKGYLSKKWDKTYGCGLGWGYVHRLGSTRWKLEANAALGWLHTRYDRYHAAEEWAQAGQHYYNWHNAPEDYQRYKNKLNYLGLTRIGISISYDL